VTPVTILLSLWLCYVALGLLVLVIAESTDPAHHIGP
jgi:hypothetical protein